MSSEKGLEADPLRREKSAQEMQARELAAARQQLLCADRQNRANETSEQGGERLRAEERKRAAVKRVNETSEQREERLAAQRKRAAFKVSNESSKDREERSRAVRERAAAKRYQENSQEKELRLRSRRERAALMRRSETQRIFFSSGVEVVSQWCILNF